MSPFAKRLDIKLDDAKVFFVRLEAGALESLTLLNILACEISDGQHRGLEIDAAIFCVKCRTFGLLRFLF